MTQSSTTPPAKAVPPERSLRIPSTIAYYAAFVALGLTSASLGPTLPGLAEHTRASLSQASYLFTARSLGYLVGSFRGGRLYDRLPGHPLMALSLLAMAATAALVPVMPLLWLLSIALFALGVGEGILDVGGNTLLVWIHGRELGPFMSGLHFFFGLGAFLSPVIIARAVLISGDIDWAYWVLALLALPMALNLLRLRSPARPAGADGAAGGRNDSLLLALIVVFFFLHVGAEASMGGWVYTYALRMGLCDVTTAAYLTSAFWGSLTMGRLLAVPISARLAPKVMLVADVVACLASLAVILLWPGSRLAAWVGTCGAGLAIASLFPTSLSFAERSLAITGRVTGWFLVGASAGGMSLPWLIGQLFERIGPRVTMSIILVDVAIAAGVLAALLVRSARLAGRGTSGPARVTP
ncbi:MAG: MFS transporter [Anaerolineae bacterium]|nr:MFS transporter [Anaerolineae bacterium]